MIGDSLTLLRRVTHKLINNINTVCPKNYESLNYNNFWNVILNII